MAFQYKNSEFFTAYVWELDIYIYVILSNAKSL